MNQRPSGYEPDELPDCSIPQQQKFSHLHQLIFWIHKLVRKGGLEPPRPKALPPQGSVSTNSTTTAAVSHSSSFTIKLKAKYSITRLVLVQLSKFQAFFAELALSQGQILDRKHLRFAVLQNMPN